MILDFLDSKGFKQCAEILGEIGVLLLKLPEETQTNIREIRIRRGRPLTLNTAKGELFVTSTGRTSAMPCSNLFIANENEIEECFHSICDYSIHSHAEDIRQGFVTIEGGHRAGICGTAIVSDGKISGIRNISSINLRVASQIHGVADGIIKLFGDGVKNTLIAGAPSSGKTTLLKDIIRQLSSGYIKKYLKVSVVDSRGELGAVHRGTPQNDLGVCTDILDGYPRAVGMETAVRTLSPDIIVCDEIGNKSDSDAVLNCINSGVSIIATIHAGSEKELLKKEIFNKLEKNNIFNNIVILKGPCSPGEISRVLQHE